MKIKNYDPIAAVHYAHTWALSRSPKYYDFSNLGGDCSNFCSQCIYAGSNQMNYAKDTGWYYRNVHDRTPSWTSVEYLYKFLINNKGLGPFAKEISMNDVQVGDIVQLSFDGIQFAHSLFIISTDIVPNLDNILISAHTYDADYRPLSTYSFYNLRFMQIQGIRIGG